jgi:aminoglycoside phosphotransferase (APT) family kinase protein
MMAMFEAMWTGFADRYRDTLTPVALEVGPHLPEFLMQLRTVTSTPLTPVHGDFRLDNMLFDASSDARPLAVVDWQTVQLGVGPTDVAYFLGSAFEPDVRRACERDLLTDYHRVLVEQYGVADYPFEQCWRDYARASYSCLTMAVFASMIVGRTDRGDEMFMAMANRSAQMGADLDAPSLIRDAG